MYICVLMEQKNAFPFLATLRLKLMSLPEKNKLFILSLVVGICSGLAAVILHTLIHGIRSGLSSLLADRSDFLLFFVLPGIGMLFSLLIVKYLIKDNIGHGVTKVLVAVSKNESRIKPHNMWSSILTSSLTIGFGGSVGAEAPIVYTGAAIGSNFGRYLGLSYRSVTILLGCGAAGAVAGIFKAPLAGVLFCLEILLFNISMTSMMPLLLSTVSATVVSYLFLGDSRPFACSLSPFSMVNMPFYLLLGFFCGGCSLYFLRTTLWLEDKLGGLKNRYLRWLLCALGLGLLIFLFPPLYGEGYDSVSAILNGGADSEVKWIFPEGIIDRKWIVLIFFVAIMLVKVYATAFTNAGGGVGGTFGPTIFTGAITGFVLARLVGNLGIASLPEANFTLVGMAGLMAGVMQAPLTAIFLVAEITGGYSLMFPLMITSAISFATIRIFEQYSIYSKRVAQQGDLLTHDSDRAVLTLLRTSDFIEKDFKPIEIGASLGDLVKIIASSNRNIVPVVDSDNIFQGIVLVDDVRSHMFNESLYNRIHIYNLVKDAPGILSQDERMESVMDKFESTGAWNLPVTDADGHYIGFVSKSKIFSSYRDQLHQVSHD